MFNGINSMMNINIDFEKINQSKNEIVQEELEEFLDEFKIFSEGYIKQQAEEYDDEVTQEVIEDFAYEAIETFSYDYENTHGWDGISDRTYNYMKKQLPMEDQQYIENKLTQNKEEKIMSHFLKKKIFNE